MRARPLAACLFFALVFLVVPSGNAAAGTIGFQVKINFTSGGPADTVASFDFVFFESTTYVWPGTQDGTRLTHVHTTLIPGTTSLFYLFLTNVDLTHLYFAGGGSYYLGQGMYGAFVAEPLQLLSDGDIYHYGAPGNLLAALANGGAVGGQLRNFYGYGRPGFYDGSWEVTTTPEPSTVVLLVSGLAAMAMRRRFWTRA